jgi:hypothetical protein
MSATPATTPRRLHNAADPELVDEQRRNARRKREGEIADLRAAMADPVASRVLWRVLAKCHVYETSFTGHGSRDAFNEGERNIGLFLIAEMTEADPAGFAKLMTEEKSRDV